MSALLGSLPPEEGRSYEVGAKVEIVNGITATAALFDIVKSNVLYTEVINGVSFSRTAGRVGSRGFELDVAGRITEHWSVIGSYAYIDAKVLEDPLLTGKQLGNVARNTASAFVTYDFGTLFGGNLRVGMGGRYVGARAGDPSNTFFLPDYALADAFVSYRTAYNNLPVTWQLNLKNMLDKTYYVSSLSNTVVSLGDPREVTLQAKVEF